MAQSNLVPNSGFDYPLKRKVDVSIFSLRDWESPDDENPADVYSTELKKEHGLPENQYGFVTPLSSPNVAGVRMYSYRDALPRTYLQVKLSSALTAGNKYCVRFNVMLAKLSKYGINNIGMYVSETKPRKNDLEANTIKPQVMDGRNQIFADQFEWDEICGIYEAQGNERYVTIGCFAPTSDFKKDQDYKQLRRPRGYSQLQLRDAYYYIDDISFINVEELGACNCGDEEEQDMKIVYHSNTSEGMEKTPAEELSLINIYFDSDKKLPSSAAGVNDAIKILETNPDIKVRIVGHMDAKEDMANMNDLGMERANSIRDYLVKRGISADRLSVESMRSNAPADDSGTVDSLARNRRVEFKVTE